MFRRFGRFWAVRLDQCRHDVRCALRSIARSPIACAVAVISLAAGIGSTTATLTLRNAIFYNPPPLYRDPGQLSRVELSTPDRRRAAVPGSLYSIWMADEDLAARSAAATPPRAAELRRTEGVEAVRARSIAPGFFALLGVSPALGRSCSSHPPAAGSTEVVLSHRIWQNLFEGRSDAVGREVWLDEQPHRVVGVLPPRFWFRTTDSLIWVCAGPQAIAQAAAVDVVVRRGSGASEAALAERLQRDAPEYLRRHAGELRDIRVRAMHVGGTGLGDQMAVVIPWLVGMAVLLTLLIACANVAILMFARWTSREREIAIRASLGAGRWRTLGLLLTESVVLAIAGGLLGVSVTLVMRGLFERSAPGPLDFDLSIDRGILLQSAFVTILAGILSGLMPALYETRRLQTNPLRLLHQSDRVRQRLRHALVVMEISVTVALMVVAAGQVEASRRMLAGDIGFRTAPLLTVRVENPAGAELSAVLEAVRRVPGVASAAASTDVPMAIDGGSERVAGSADRASPVAALRALITNEYFATLDVSILAGRTFAPADLNPSSRVAIVDAPLARQLWPDGNTVGARIWVQDEPYEVVGVVAGYSSGPLRQPAPRFYLPYSTRPPGPTRVQLVVRAVHDPIPLVGAVREEVRQLGSGYTVPSAYALDQVIQAGAGEIMALSYALSPLLGIGLFLTATGIFGVLAFAIARRSKELALRVALGATNHGLRRLVAAHTLRLLLTGATAGVAATFALTRMVAAGGEGSSFDTPGWQAFAVPVLVVLAVGALATWIPARRAMRIDPVVLLKAE